MFILSLLIFEMPTPLTFYQRPKTDQGWLQIAKKNIGYKQINIIFVLA